MRIFILLFILVSNFCFAQNDYSITNRLKQTIAVKNNTVLEIECYCPNGFKVNETSNATAMQNIILEIKATENSVGYHGNQQKPEKIDEKYLRFNVEEKKHILKITSNEWSFMHHAFMIDSLIITTPKGMKYKFTHIKGNTLESRKNPITN